MKRICLSLSALLWMISCSAESHLLSISGTITLSSQLASKLESSDTLQILLFSQDPVESASEEKTKKNPKKNITPIAIQKIAPVNFPFKYKISEEDILLPDNRSKENLSIIARIEKNRENHPKEKRSLEGSYKKKPISLGSKNIDIVIDQEKP